MWGGESVSIVQIREDDPFTLNIVTSLDLLDWVLDAKFSPYSSIKWQAALVTAHNTVILLSIEKGQDVNPCLKYFNTDSKSLLYSARIFWESQNDLFVTSGTCFGEVITWSLQVSDSAKTVVHDTLRGHEGSIFDLAISTFTGNQQKFGYSRIIASCSDDRTLRLWGSHSLAATLPDLGLRGQVDEVSTQIQTNTGFNSSRTMTDEIKCFAQAMGHLSRIWAVEFLLTQSTKQVLHLVTFGEDATCQFWSCNLDGGRFSLTNVGQSVLHNGKNIWSHDIRKVSETEFLIATGGADGSIRLTTRDVNIQHHTSQKFVLPTHFQKSLPSRETSDKLRSFSLVNIDLLLLITDRGDVYTQELDQSDIIAGMNRSFVTTEPGLRGFSVVSAIHNPNLVIVQSRLGALFLYGKSIGWINFSSIADKKVVSLFASKTLMLHNGVECNVCLSTFVESNTARVYCLSQSIHRGSLNQEALHHFGITLPSGHKTTNLFCVNHYMLLGQRDGQILLYDTLKRGWGASDTLLSPSLTAKVFQDGITDICMLSNDGVPHVMMSCRDGSICIVAIRESTASVAIEVLHKLAVPGLSEVHCIFRDDNTGRVIAAGFRRKSFVLWDLSNQRQLAEIPCEGSSRPWQFFQGGESQPHRFAWIQASSLHISHVYEVIDNSIQPGMHGREIKAVAVSPNASEIGQVIATASEDTDIKLSRLIMDHEGQPSMHCIHTLRKHVTGVQDLVWSTDAKYLISVGGFEELLVWRIKSVPVFDLGVLCESTCPYLSEIPDLRIASVDVENTDDGLRIAVCRSDSTVHIYNYSHEHGLPRWQCLSTMTYLTCFLTNIIRMPSENDRSFLITSTDGYVAVCDVRLSALTAEGSSIAKDGKEAMTISQRFKIHQNAVHSAELISWHDGSHVLLSGGDDNALSISIIKPPNAGQSWTISTLTIPRAHAAALTALSIIKPDLSSDKLHVVTSSIDQKIKLWQFNIVPENGIAQIHVRKLQEAYTPVADVANMCTWNANGLTWILICGVGWDLWTICL